MAYPKENSFIDMRSKIKKPVISKTRSILLELEKLKSDASVVPKRRYSLFSNRSLISSGIRARDLPSRRFLASPSVSSTPYRRRTIQPTWTTTYGASKTSPSTFDLSNQSEDSVSLKSTDDLNAPVDPTPVSFHESDAQPANNVEFSFVAPKVNGSAKELENMRPFDFDKPVMPNFFDTGLQNAFEFDLPENRGPKLATNGKDSSELILNETYFDAPPINE